MQFDNLGVVERKVLGAFMILADENNFATTTLCNLARIMGYKQPGGAITFAIRILERDNYITRVGRRKYKVLI